MKLATAGASTMVSVMPPSPQNVLRHSDEPIKAICIEFDRAVEVPDLVPAIQSALQRLGAESRVYAHGEVPAACVVTLNYSASIEWSRPLFSDEYVPYMTSADLTLRTNGRVVASASYRPALLNVNKWASTQRKISPIVNALFTPLTK